MEKWIFLKTVVGVALLPVFLTANELSKPWIQKELGGILVGAPYAETRNILISRYGTPHTTLAAKSQTFDMFVVEPDLGTLLRIDKSVEQDTVKSISVSGRKESGVLVLPRGLNVGIPLSMMERALEKFDLISDPGSVGGTRRLVADSNVVIEIYRNSIKSIKVTDTFMQTQDEKGLKPIAWLQEAVSVAGLDMGKVVYPSSEEYHIVETLRAANSDVAAWEKEFKKHNGSLYFVREYIRELIKKRRYVQAHKVLKSKAVLFGDDPTYTLLKDAIVDHTRSLSEVAFNRAQRELQKRFAEIDSKVVERALSSVTPPQIVDPAPEAPSNSPQPDAPPAAPVPEVSQNPTPQP